jgi:hypothetical protein
VPLLVQVTVMQVFKQCYSRILNLNESLTVNCTNKKHAFDAYRTGRCGTWVIAKLIRISAWFEMSRKIGLKCLLR